MKKKRRRKSRPDWIVTGSFQMWPWYGWPVDAPLLNFFWAPTGEKP